MALNLFWEWSGHPQIGILRMPPPGLAATGCVPANAVARGRDILCGGNERCSEC